MQEKKFNLTKKALILAILFLVFHLILSFLRGELNFMVPPLLTFIVDDLGANLGQGGLLQTTSTLCMGVGMIFASIVIDKIGGSKTLALSTVFMFISGLLGLTATTFTAMLFARVFAGLGNAFSFPAVVAIVAERFRDKKHLGMANSVIQATNSLTQTLTFSLTVPIFMALGQNWHYQFMMWGTSCLALGILFLVFDRKPNAFFKEYNNAQMAQENAGQAPAQQVKAAPKAKGSSLVQAIKIRPVQSAVISFTGATWLFMIFNTYLPTILKSVHGLSAQEASSITGLISLAGLFSCLLYAPIVGRIKNYKPIILLFMILLPLSGVCSMLLKPGLLLRLCVIVLGIAWGCYVPTINTAVITTKGVTPGIFAASNAIWTLFGNALAMLMPILFQTLQVRIGMQNAAIALCLGGVFAIAGALYFPSEKKTA